MSLERKEPEEEKKEIFVCPLDYAILGSIPYIIEIARRYRKRKQEEEDEDKGNIGYIR